MNTAKFYLDQVPAKGAKVNRTITILQDTHVSLIRCNSKGAVRIYVEGTWLKLHENYTYDEVVEALGLTYLTPKLTLPAKEVNSVVLEDEE